MQIRVRRATRLGLCLKLSKYGSPIEMRPIAAALVVILLLIQVAPVGGGSTPTSHEPGRQLPASGEEPSVPPPAQSQYVLSAGYYYYFSTSSYGGGTQLKFSVSSTASVDVYVMDSTQYSNFVSSGSRSAIYHSTSTSVSDSVSLPSKGDYYLVIDNDVSGTGVTLDVEYTTIPVDIYRYHTSPPAPTGVVDYGVQNTSGYLFPSKQTISSVVGSAVINSVQAYNASAPAMASPYGASLQLNVMLRVNTTTSRHVYWLQDVLALFTNNQTAYVNDNIWNASERYGTLDQTLISGSGSVSPTTNQNYYGAAAYVFSYSAPLSVKLPIDVSHSGNRVSIAFGYQEGSGGGPLGSTNFYDNATISEPAAVTDAAIVVSGYQMTPDGVYFDAELVFGGQCCGAITTFTSMDATLGISYRLSNGDTASPKAVYQFGSDTAEGAYGIRTNSAQTKFQVALGNLDLASSYPIAVPAPVRLTLSYTVSDGTQVAAEPVLTYIANGTELTATIGTTPEVFKADQGTDWKLTPTILGAAGERWAAAGTLNGTAISDQAVAVTYYHQYQLTASYALKGAGTPSPPAVQATVFGSSLNTTLSSQGTAYWVDSGSSWSVPPLLAGSTDSQRWNATAGTNGTVSGPTIVNPTYVEQDLLTVDFQIVGGGSPGGVRVNVTALGAQALGVVTQSGAGVWADDGTTFSFEELTTSSTTQERWISNSTLYGEISAPSAASPVYYHQYFVRVTSSAPSGTSVVPVSGWFDTGARVPLIASVTALWRFSDWSGSGPGSYSGGSNSTSFIASGPINESAAFDPGLRVQAGQGGSISYFVGATVGTVSPGSSVVIYEPAGTTIVLTAQPSLFQALNEWVGSTNSTENSATIILQSPSQVEATFGTNYVQVGGVVGVVLVAALAVTFIQRRRRKAV
jgi:thermopsin